MIGRMLDITVAHTSALEPTSLAASRALLFDVFDDMTDDDWDHSLGGLHAIAVDDGQVVGHAALVQRRLLHRGRALRAGYVEGVAVRADRQRSGIGAALMAPLEEAARRSYDVAALGSTGEGVAFYVARGWLRWEGPSSALTPDGVRRTTEDDGWIFVLQLGVPLDLHGGLTCDWRDGDVW
jgi:aminoglycoside 2'-N-acetyltransferase I